MDVGNDDMAELVLEEVKWLATMMNANVEYEKNKLCISKARMELEVICAFNIFSSD